jgi:hypothetical protein
MEWIKCTDRMPNNGDLVFGYGHWEGEINGKNDRMSIEWGEWSDGSIMLSGDCYSVELVDITHWMPCEVKAPNPAS